MTPEAFDLVRQWIVALGALGTVLAALAAVYVFERQSQQKRAEMFFEWNRWFDSKEGFGKDAEGAPILHYLENDDPKLRNVPFQQKEALLGFYEEIALAVNSRLLRKEVAFYMFGHYAMVIEKSKNFWLGSTEDENLNQNEWYWKLFRSFAAQMAEEHMKQLSLKKLHY